MKTLMLFQLVMMNQSVNAAPSRLDVLERGHIACVRRFRSRQLRLSMGASSVHGT
jgi:hypothetical protein